MARESKDILQSAIIGFAIPAVLLLLIIAVMKPKQQQSQHTTGIPTTGITATGGDEQTQPVDREIAVLMDGETVLMELETYVLGVVLAEMPASFEVEALKAQAVAARTYALKTTTDGKKHNGSVCTNYQCCQAYTSREAYLLRGWSEKFVERVCQAVKSTAGQVLTYDGKLIRATYFSCSGGSTEDAIAVWGRDYPYLQSVKSPGEEETVYYTDTKHFTLEAFQEALGVHLSESPQNWFGTFTYTQGGGVDTIEIGGVVYRGTTVRTLLGLRSTVFQIVVSQNGILFETKGYGHRVGMSQYGADAMALEGYTYQQILSHYYRDTDLMDYLQLELEHRA